MLFCPMYPYLLDLISCFQLLVLFTTFYFSQNLTNFLLHLQFCYVFLNSCTIYFIISGSRVHFFSTSFISWKCFCSYLPALGIIVFLLCLLNAKFCPLIFLATSLLGAQLFFELTKKPI